MDGRNLPQCFHFQTCADSKTLLLYDDVGIFKSEDSVKWYECCYYVSLLDSNLRQTASNDWHNKLYHYDGIFSQLFPIVLVYSLKWYFFSRNVIHVAFKFLSVYYTKKSRKKIVTAPHMKFEKHFFRWRHIRHKFWKIKNFNIDFWWKMN